MGLPNHPPLDDKKGLSLTDVYGCIWFVWQHTLQDMQAFPAPIDLMARKVKDAFPAKNAWGVGVDPEGRARKFFQDIQSVLDGYTGFRANVGFKSLVAAFDGGKTWGDLAALVHSKAIYVAGLKRARAIEALGQ